MKKLAFILTTTLCLCSCGSDYYREQVDELKRERSMLHTEVSSLRKSCTTLGNQKSTLQTEVRNLEAEHNALSKGIEPNYILTLEIKQGTFTLDIGEHVKNSINAITMQIPVSKSFYNNVTIGTRITDEFKVGSLILNGDFSKLRVTVKNKEIRY